jgi:hypothetical protein
VGGTLEVAGYGRFETLLLLGDYKPHARKAPPLQRAKQILVGDLALGVRNFHREYLPQPIVPDCRDDQYRLAHHPRVHPHFEDSPFTGSVHVTATRWEVFMDFVAHQWPVLVPIFLTVLTA